MDHNSGINSAILSAYNSNESFIGGSITKWIPMPTVIGLIIVFIIIIIAALVKHNKIATRAPFTANFLFTVAGLTAAGSIGYAAYRRFQLM